MLDFGVHFVLVTPNVDRGRVERLVADHLRGDLPPSVIPLEAIPEPFVELSV